MLNLLSLCLKFQVTKAPPSEVVIFNPETEEWTKKIVNVSKYIFEEWF
jgi:hypothetical protein